MSGEHPHDHQHPHPHRHEAGQGPVMIDVGAGAGALVLRTSADMVGAEIDITPVGNDDVRRHVAVHTRPVPGHAAVHAAVYDGLDAGRYRLWWPPGTVAGEVEVRAEGVTETEWADLVATAPADPLRPSPARGRGGDAV